MEDQQVALVQDSWDKFKPFSETAARLFYGKLFELDPSTKALFSIDMDEQGEKLMEMIDQAVQGLAQPEMLITGLQGLGHRHEAYGVKPEHYDTMRTALIWTLGEGLGDDFTPAAEAAWTETYGLLSGVMKQTFPSA